MTNWKKEFDEEWERQIATNGYVNRAVIGLFFSMHLQEERDEAIEEYKKEIENNTHICPNCGSKMKEMFVDKSRNVYSTTK